VVVLQRFGFGSPVLSKKKKSYGDEHQPAISSPIKPTVCPGTINELGAMPKVAITSILPTRQLIDQSIKTLIQVDKPQRDRAKYLVTT